MLRAAISVDVSAAVPFDGEYALGGWVCAPEAVDMRTPPVVVCCLAGGTCSTAYFDLDVPGHKGYSMAEYLVDDGYVVLALDHLGIGESSPVVDIFELTPYIVSAANHHAHRELLDRLEAGTLVRGLDAMPGLVAVAAGHSMGGMLASVQQANHSTFDAIAVLGSSASGLPAFIGEAELAIVGDADAYHARIVELARARFTGAPRPGVGRNSGPMIYNAPDVLPAAREAFIAHQVPLLNTCGLTTMIPGTTLPEKARVTVPVFLAFGELDLVRNFHETVAHYSGSSDVTLFVLPGAGHLHNQASNRELLWDRLATWIDTVTAP